MAFGPLVIVTGPPGAGKSSVAKQLAQASPSAQAVHLHADDFYASIVKGSIAPWRAEAHAQNAVIIDAIVASARCYAGGGCEVVVDGVFGPWFLEPWLALAREGFDVHYAVLRPNEPTTVARGTARTAANALVDARVISDLWQQFANLGPFEPHAFDTTALTLDETVTRIRLAIAQGTLLVRAP